MKRQYSRICQASEASEAMAAQLLETLSGYGQDTPYTTVKTEGDTIVLHSNFSPYSPRFEATVGAELDPVGEGIWSCAWWLEFTPPGKSTERSSGQMDIKATSGSELYDGLFLPIFSNYDPLYS